MKNAIIDRLGAFAEAQVRGYQAALVGLTSDAMNPGAGNRRQFVASIQRLQSSTLTSIAAVFDVSLRQVSGAALENAHPSADLNTQLLIQADADAQREAALGTVAQALARDGETALGRMRDFSLRVDMLMNGGGRSHSSAVIAAGVVERQKGITFGQSDTLGRRWKSSTFVAATLRGALQGTYADAFVRAAAARGDAAVVLQYPEAEHDGHGQVVPLADPETGYLAVRDTVFHPNSSAWLAREE